MSATSARRAHAIDTLIQSLPRLCLVVGKGGVGKTTCATGLTASFARRRERTLLVSTDPAGSLGTVLGITLTPGDQRELDELPGCAVLQLDAASARSDFLARWRNTIVTIMDRGTYLDMEDITGLVDAALPGGDEIFALLRLAEIVGMTSGAAWERIVIDTAPTGHTLRLLSLPETFEAMIALLDAMQAKHRFMVTALTHRYRTDAADDFLAAMRHAVGSLRAALGDAQRCAAILVSRAERVVVSETCRYARDLARLRIALAAVIVNARDDAPGPETWHAMHDLEGIAPSSFELPRMKPPPAGVVEIAALMRRLRALPAHQEARKSVHSGEKGLDARVGSVVALVSGGGTRTAIALSLLRTLTIVGGKGGVGKSTVAVALALLAASERADRVLLVSTDPAPSIGDALGISDPAWARRGVEPFAELPRLDVWQMDAGAEFEALRDRYRERIDQLFDAWIGRGIDPSPDRMILRDLLALAPPGIDELFALSALGEILDERRYDRIVVDPAPTGHLLRLLEMPAIALDWSHRLMRLLLKYRDIAGLGDAARELVAFSRRTRALDGLLHDHSRAGIVLVALDEPVVSSESVRLFEALEKAGVAVLGVVWNRVTPTSRLDATDTLPKPLIVAPETAGPLVGSALIAGWCHSWRLRD